MHHFLISKQSLNKKIPFLMCFLTLMGMIEKINGLFFPVLKHKLYKLIHTFVYLEIKVFLH